MGIVTSTDFLPEASFLSSLIRDFFLLLGFGDGTADTRALKSEALFLRISAGAVEIRRGGVGDCRARTRDTLSVEGDGGKVSMERG